MWVATLAGLVVPCLGAWLCTWDTVAGCHHRVPCLGAIGGVPRFYGCVVSLLLGLLKRTFKPEKEVNEVKKIIIYSNIHNGYASKSASVWDSKIGITFCLINHQFWNNHAQPPHLESWKRLMMLIKLCCQVSSRSSLWPSLSSPS